MNRYLPPIILALLITGCSEPPATPAAKGPVVEQNTISFPAGSNQTDSLRIQRIEMQPVPPVRLNGRLAWNEDSTVRVFTPFAGRVERILV